uniref:Variant surface glycoprotein 1186 n=1 Tax=Trypanosoma brucei TaxID=5691 RepID=M4SVR2_9TRYP|nr:variant surface glycoprotein 1186 [Trypanosoma brucei]
MHKLAAIICVIASLHTTEGTSAAFEETAVNKLCKVASALLPVPKFFTDKQKMLKRQITDGNEAAVKALLAAATGRDHNKSTVFTAIAVAALDCAHEGTKKLNDLVEPAVKAMTNAAKAAGCITEFAEFLRQVSKGRANGFCLSAQNSATTAEHVQGLGCPAEIVDSWANADTALQSEVSDTGFKNVNTPNAKATTATDTCPILKGAADARGTFWQTTRPGEQKFFAGFVSATPHNSANSDTILIEDRTKKATKWKISAAADASDKIYNLISDLRNFKLGDFAQTADDLITQLIDTGAAKEIITNSISPKDASGKAVDVQTVANDMITSVAERATERGDQIKEKINSASVPQVTGGKTTMKKLKDEKDSKQHRYSLLPQQQSRLAALKSLEERVAAAGRKAESSETETIDTCEAKGTGDNCKDGCKEITENGEKKCVKDPDYKPKQVDGGEKKLTKCSDATMEE